jgi:hypothetical protein
MRILIYIITILLITSCYKDKIINPQKPLLASINSAAVAFKYSDPVLQNFFQNPSQAYISAYFYFEPDLADDIIFGLDIEWTEGVDQPIHFPGADWMSLVGVTRKGLLYFPIGYPENLNGTPTNTDQWIIKDLGLEFQPNQWYKMTITANFELRKFVSVKIENNQINIEEDLSQYPLEYPNYIPIDKPSLTFYGFALRSKEFAPHNSGGTKVYFDDFSGGILINGSFNEVFSNDVENQTNIRHLPITLPVTPLSDISENIWYYENDEAKVKINSNIYRNGHQSLECNASLEK